MSDIEKAKHLLEDIRDTVNCESASNRYLEDVPRQIDVVQSLLENMEEPKLTDLETSALVHMLDAFVAEGWITQPYPEEYYSLFKKLGHDPTTEAPAEESKEVD